MIIHCARTPQMTVVKTSNHHLYDVDASIYSNGNEKDNMILHYHQNPSANIIKNTSTNIFYATNLHFFYHTDDHGFSFHMDGRRESRILFLHTESHGVTRRAWKPLKPWKPWKPLKPWRVPESPEAPESPETPDVPDNLDSPEPPSEGKVTNCKFGA